ncbi:MAG: hypothetical protein DSY37_04385 [Hyperthermus sp.]|nr:MAG: hypothetical protein DSY37_04385 [Hyperthermus sp.]
MYRVTGCIGVEGYDERVLEAIGRALETEAKNPPDPSRGRASIDLTPRLLRVCFEARDLSAARTLVNTYLSLAAAVLDSVAAVSGERDGAKAPA